MTSSSVAHCLGATTRATPWWPSKPAIAVSVPPSTSTTGMRSVVACRTSASRAVRRVGTTSSRRDSRRAANASSTGRRPATSSSPSPSKRSGVEGRWRHIVTGGSGAKRELGRWRLLGSARLEPPATARLASVRRAGRSARRRVWPVRGPRPGWAAIPRARRPGRPRPLVPAWRALARSRSVGSGVGRRGPGSAIRTRADGAVRPMALRAAAALAMILPTLGARIFGADPRTVA